LKLNEPTIASLAELLEGCQMERRSITKITDQHPDMDWEDAYAVQDRIRGIKLGRGHRIAGLKAGLTSHAKMKQMNVDTPCFGFLLDSYAIAPGGECRVDSLIHPRIEPEIVFVMKRALRGPGCHIGDVFSATEYVIPGIEVLDSRYTDFKFDLRSVIADNLSASGFAIGGIPTRVDAQDLSTTGLVLEVNGRPVVFSAGASVLGHPATAIAMMANELGKRGQEIPAGAVILSGGTTEAVAVRAGDSVSLRVHGMGGVGICFV
jgi:2-oxo-3-hexenedioate decarboxylase